ncbi:MAG: OsmC family protein [Gemmatimonadota bacterium]
MTPYTAEIRWDRGDAPFVGNHYSRRHRWHFDGGADVPASASPHVVREPLSDPSAVDPEEAFVAALTSCHMLFFLSFAAARGFVVDQYVDLAVGVMGRNAAGRTAMVLITLHPAVNFSGNLLPSADAISELHHQAHEECYIANSVTCEVRCEPVHPGPA